MFSGFVLFQQGVFQYIARVVQFTVNGGSRGRGEANVGDDKYLRRALRQQSKERCCSFSAPALPFADWECGECSSFFLFS